MAVISAVGSTIFKSFSTTKTQSVTPSAVGNCWVYAVASQASITNVSGGSATNWRRMAGPNTNTGGTPLVQFELWIGEITSTATANITVTSGSGTTQVGGYIQQFSSTAGAATQWTQDGSGGLRNSVTNSTTVQFPTMTPSGADRAYVGVAIVGSDLSGTGVTSGYTLFRDTTFFNGMIYNPRVTGAQSPVASQTSSSDYFTLAALFSAEVPTVTHDATAALAARAEASIPGVRVRPGTSALAQLAQLSAAAQQGHRVAAAFGAAAAMGTNAAVVQPGAAALAEQAGWDAALDRSRFGEANLAVRSHFIANAGQAGQAALAAQAGMSVGEPTQNHLIAADLVAEAGWDVRLDADLNIRSTMTARGRFIIQSEQEHFRTATLAARARVLAPGAAIRPTLAALASRARIFGEALRVGVGQQPVFTARARVTAIALGIGPVQGKWFSHPLPIKEGIIGGSQITWDATVPPGATLLVETSTDNGATWQPTENGGEIPRLKASLPTPRALLARVTMTRQVGSDPSPELHRLDAQITVNYSRNEFVQLGKFMINEVSITDTSNGMVIEIAGADLARKVSRNRWDKTFVIPEGTNVGDAIQLMIRNRYPQAQFNFCSVPDETIRLFYGEQDQNDPWQDAQELAISVGCELFFDAYGICTLRFQPDPAQDQSVWEFDDRAHPVITELVRRVTDEFTYNYVVVTGESSYNERPVRGWAADDDPGSPTYYLGPYGIVALRVTSPTVRTQYQAIKAAQALLLKVKGATESVNLTTVPMPAVEPSDVVTVTRGRSKTEGRFVVEQLTIPLAPSEPMRAVCRRQRY